MSASTLRSQGSGPVILSTPLKEGDVIELGIDGLGSQKQLVKRTKV